MERINFWKTFGGSFLLTAVMTAVATPIILIRLDSFVVSISQAELRIYWGAGFILGWILIHTAVKNSIPQWRCARCGRSDYTKDLKGTVRCSNCTK